MLTPSTRLQRIVARAALLALSLTTFVVTPALSAHETEGAAVEAETVEGNATCPAGTVSLKNDAPNQNATITGELDGQQVSVTLTDTSRDGTEWSFVVDGPALMAYFIAKAGPVANVYDYRGLTAGGIGHDDHLRTPIRNGNKRYELSHGDFCLVPEPPPVPSIAIDEQVTPATLAEPGGLADWTVTVTNDGPSELSSIVLVDTDATFDSLLAASCAVPSLLAAGDSFTCAYTSELTGAPGDTFLTDVTVTAQDAAGQVVTATDAATPTIVDVPPVVDILTTPRTDTLLALGGEIVLDQVVTNVGDETFTLTSLTDAVLGDIDGLGTCDITSTPVVLAPGDTYTCELPYDAPAADAGTVLTGTSTVDGADDEGTTTTASDPWTITYLALPTPSVRVTETPSVTSLPEPGGAVTWTVEVTNTGPSTLKVTALQDAVYGDLNGAGSCTTGDTLAPGASTTCTYDALLEGQPGEVFAAPVTVTAVDEYGTVATDDDVAQVTITDVASTLAVTKTASVTELAEPGGDVTWTVTVTNPSAVDTITLDSVDDSQLGDLLAADACAGQNADAVLAPGDAWTCAYTTTIDTSVLGPITNLVDVTGTDDDGRVRAASDDAAVTITDVPSSIELVKTADVTSVTQAGEDVTYTVTITNTSVADTVTVQSLGDSVVDLAALCPSLLTTLAPGASVSCSYTTFVTGAPGAIVTNVATANAIDDDGGLADATDSASVDVTDLPGSVAVVKTAAPATVVEPSGTVTWSVVVTNTSVADVITLDAVLDDSTGDLLALCGDGSPVSLAVGGTFTCTYDTTVTGVAGDTFTNTVDVAATDDTGTPLSATDQAVVEVLDGVSSLVVTKSANVGQVAEPGGDVLWTVTITNTSVVDTITFTSLDDSEVGDLTTVCDLPASLAAGETATCTYAGTVTGNAGDATTNVVDVTGTDDEGDVITGTDQATVTVADLLPTLEVVETAGVGSLPEPGGDVTWTTTVTNLSAEPITLTSLDDATYGDLTAAADTTCALVEIAVGGSYSCTYTGAVSGDAGDLIGATVTATGADDEGNTASDTSFDAVVLTDVAPTVELVKDVTPATQPEPGSSVTWTVTVTNTSGETVTITELTDTRDGDLLGLGDCAAVTLAAGASTSCSYATAFTGNAGDVASGLATVVVVDNDGSTASASDDAAATLTDVPSAISVTKVADVETVDEPGGPVAWTVTITNDSAVDSVTLDAVTDSELGDLLAGGACALDTTLAPGRSTTCVYVTDVTGNAGDTTTNVVDVTATDDDGFGLLASASDAVTIADALPGITVTETADPGTLPEPGGDVTWTTTVTNTAGEPVTVTALVDETYGDLTAALDSTCVLPVVLAPGASFSCTYTGPVAGNAADVFTAPVTATASDDEGNVVTATDADAVTLSDVPSSITLVKTVDTPSQPEPGGDVVWSILITNTSAVDSVTLDTLVDDDLGDLTDACAVAGVVLAPGASTSCDVPEAVSGNAGDVFAGTATIAATDDDGNGLTAADDAATTLTDVLPTITVVETAGTDTLPEPGGDVTWTTTVTNTAGEPVTVTALVDETYGDLTAALDSTCVLPVVLAPGASFSCTYTGPVAGNAADVFTAPVTATASDDEGNVVTATDADAVTLSDVPSSITLVKTVDTPSQPEPGGDVVWSILITNTSAVDSVTLDTLVDDDLGDLTDACAVAGVVLAPGASTTCDVPETIQGTVSDVFAGTATVAATDDDGNALSAAGDAETVLTDVLPTITVVETAGTDTLPEPGGDVTWTTTVTNTSVEPVTVTSLVDDTYGDLTAALDTTCALPVVLAPGASFSCTYTGPVAGNAGQGFTAPVTATASDDEGNVVTATHADTVILTDVASSMEVTKVADTATVDEPGGPVLWTVTVTNTSTVDTITLTSVSDSEVGQLLTSGLCSLETVLAPGASTECAYTTDVLGNAGDTTTNTVDVTAVDDDGVDLADTASDSVTVADVLPTLAVEKTVVGDAFVTTQGGLITYKARITNTSVEAVTLTSLVDETFGDLFLAGDCLFLLGDTLAPGEWVTCQYTEFVIGEAGDVIDGNVTATATDDEGNEATASDPEPVEVLVVARGEVLATGTTCEEFLLDTDTDLNRVEYQEKDGYITGVAPGAMFHYTELTVDAAGEVLTVEQTVDPAEFGIEFSVNNDQIFLYDATTCERRDDFGTVSSDGGDASITFTEAAVGEHIVISIKYAADAFKDVAVPTDGMAQYSFTTYRNGQLWAFDTDGVLLIDKQLNDGLLGL